MKIALCLSGQPRFYKEGYNQINKKILNKNTDIDIFTHFWFDENDINGQYSNMGTHVKNYRDDIIERDLPKKLIKIYNPKKSFFEPQYDIFKHLVPNQVGNNHKIKPNLFALFSMYYSMYKSMMLKKQYELENDFEYDIVVKCRYDIILQKEIIFSNYNNDKVYFQNVFDTLKKNPQPIGDVIFFGNNEYVEKICKSHLDFPDFFNEHIYDNHLILGKILDSKKIPYEKAEIGIVELFRNKNTIHPWMTRTKFD